MSAKNAKTNDKPPVMSRRLWVDGCGGFLLLSGSRWSVGGLSQGHGADICVRADWPRRAGELERVAGDYFWESSEVPSRRVLIADGQRIPTTGSAVMKLFQPSPLSHSAVLRLGAPHRFDQHVDGVILVHQTVLIGPGRDCHIQHRDLQERAILVQREQGWEIKYGLAGEFQPLQPGRRIELASLTMTLEAP